MPKRLPKLEESWRSVLATEMKKTYFKSLKQFVFDEYDHQIIYPEYQNIFQAFNHTPFDKTKAVIIGQDPYHGAGQAHGLCFSVLDGVRQPPSLKNIFKELHTDLNLPIPETGNLTNWAEQGVLMLNSTLTVRESSPASHKGKGWETFTDKVISILSEKKENLVFILWGNFAIAKEKLINSNKHFILKAAHPSPFSAYNGFFGCQHFSKTNIWLTEKNISEINWKL